MKVIFLKNVKGVGRVGYVKDVSDGYARNYLLPKKLAEAATEGVIKKIQSVLVKENDKRGIAEQEAKKLAQEIEGQILEVSARASESGKLFGSVSRETIAAVLSEKVKRSIPEDLFELEEPIKQIGEYEIIIKFSSVIESKIRVIVKREE